MFRIKKILPLLLAACLCVTGVSLTGCGAGGDTGQEAAQEQTAEAAQPDYGSVSTSI